MEGLRPDLARRVALTVAVRDTDAIPKVPGAGEVRDLDGRRVQVMHNGVLIEEGCYHGAMTTEIIRALRGHHEPQEEAVFHALLERLAEEGAPRPVMVELGAFWSYYSMWFNRRLPGAVNVMVEPDPVNIEVGRRNFALNDMTGSFVHGAVGFDHGGEVWLPCESDWRVRRTPTVSLAGLMADERLERIDLVLCDAQGAEVGVLESSLDVLRAGRVRFLVVSTHHHTITGDPLTHQRCLELLRGAGAHVIAEHSVAESCSGDGLIAASVDPRDAGWEVPVSHVRARDSVFGELEHDLARAQRWDGPARRTAAGLVERVRWLTRRERATAPR
ncbi:FkbM family methyltransferase [Baekduia soli]|uniref:FkbM family methyltransferase n=1 Tax=Baekduia soli TaxID=496014 RepID=A0A5B8TZV3_9ACTN|nr:FkbM family methyltransferase [Baekduia soli]QEC46258.1 FkbM family methyltransferase [Baekduia soli]